MGMYTELYLGVRLVENLPEKVVAALQYLVSEAGKPVPPVKEALKTHDLPDHPFFAMSRSRWCLFGGSYYFDSQSTRNLHWDDITSSWYLTFVANIKNYEQEWQCFLDWLNPYIDTEGHIGHCRYEESDFPTILFRRGGEIEWVEVKDPKEHTTEQVEQIYD